MSENAIIVLMGWVFALAIFFGFIVLLRYLQHRERMALISQGINPGTMPKHQRSKGILRAGLITMMVGLALTLGLYPIGFILPSNLASTPFHLGPWLLPGLIPFAVGLALTVSYYLEQTTQTQEIDKDQSEKVISLNEHLDRERQDRN
jgi:hypothetical protein